MSGEDVTQVVRGTRAAKALDDEGGSLDWRSEWYPVAFTKDVPEGACLCVRAAH